MSEQNFDLYRDIAKRTDGDVYIGVVGPVRTGKSTLISRMMEELVLSRMAAGPRRERLTDELPQSGSGKTIMTTQPKFVPSEAVSVTLDDQSAVRVRMVDSVGYLVEGALGTEEDGASRYTPRGSTTTFPLSRRRRSAPGRSSRITPPSGWWSPPTAASPT